MMRIFLMSVCFCLLSCSPYKRSFNCPHAQGKPCTSLSRIHELVDQGAFSSDGKHQENSPAHQSPSCAHAPCCKKQQSLESQSVPALIIHEGYAHTVMLQAPLQPAPSQTSKDAT